MSTPAFTPDGKGGGTIHVTVPQGTRQAMAVLLAFGASGTGTCVQSHTADAFYTVLIHGNGKQNAALPDSLGPQTQSGKPTPTICPKGTYQLYAVAANYPIFQAAYPRNLSQLPKITGSNGQADISTSDIFSGTYPLYTIARFRAFY